MPFKTCTALEGDPRLSPRLAVDKTKLWYPGHVIQIGFMGGTATQNHKVIQMASEWMRYANIEFVYGYHPDDADIRISFQRGKGSWSYMGKDALLIAPRVATMNFGWLYDETSDEEWSRTVLHEFGHMLGAIHEHQSPAAGIKWDKPLVYQYYWQTQGWSKEMVDHNIFSRYDQDISNTEFDPESIMLYPVEQKFTLDDFSVGWNRRLSEADKRFIEEMYPFDNSC